MYHCCSKCIASSIPHSSNNSLIIYVMNKEESVKLIVQMEQMANDFEANIERVQKMVKGITIHNNLGQHLLYALSRDHRMLLFVIMLNESSNLKTDWVTAYHLLKEAYIMTDNIYAQLLNSPYPFDLNNYLLEMKQHVNTEELMHTEELDFLNGLHFPLTVYRGMCNKEFENGSFGISWTDKEKTASRYVFYSKNNNQDTEGKIVSFKIDRSDIFAVWGADKMDKELIIPGLKMPKEYGLQER